MHCSATLVGDVMRLCWRCRASLLEMSGDSSEDVVRICQRMREQACRRCCARVSDGDTPEMCEHVEDVERVCRRGVVTINIIPHQRPTIPSLDLIVRGRMSAQAPSSKTQCAQISMRDEYLCYFCVNLPLFLSTRPSFFAACAAQLFC